MSAEDAVGMPRWVKVFIGVGIVVAIVAVAAMIVDPGEHGPSRHTPASIVPDDEPMDGPSSGTSGPSSPILARPAPTRAPPWR